VGTVGNHIANLFALQDYFYKIYKTSEHEDKKKVLLDNMQEIMNFSEKFSQSM